MTTKIRNAIDYAKGQVHDSTCWSEDYYDHDLGTTLDKYIDNAIAAELQSARAEALEQAAKVAENFQNSAAAIGISGNAAVYDELTAACESIAKAIRSLKDTQ